MSAELCPNDEAFTAVYRQMSKRVGQYLFSVLQDDWEDVAQGVWVAIKTHLDDGNGFRKSPEHLVMTIARLRARDWIKQKTRRTARETTYCEMIGLSDDEIPVNPFARLADKEARKHATALIESLSPQAREILRLRYDQKKSIRQIADVIEISKSSAQRQCREAILELKEAFHER